MGEDVTKMSIGKLITRGIRKIVFEITSIKSLLLIFVCIGSWQGFVEDTVAIAAALALVGFREVPLGDLFSSVFKNNPQGDMMIPKITIANIKLFLLAHWKLVGIIIIALILMTTLYTRADQKLWQVIKDSIVDDQTAIVEQLETANIQLNQERDILLNSKAKLEQDNAKLYGRIHVLSGRVDELQKQIDNIIVPVDPGGIADEFKRRGFHPTVLPGR